MRSPGRLSGAQQSRGCNLQGRQMHTWTHTHTHMHTDVITDQEKQGTEEKKNLHCFDHCEKDVIARLWEPNSEILHWYFHLASWDIFSTTLQRHHSSFTVGAGETWPRRNTENFGKHYELNLRAKGQCAEDVDTVITGIPHSVDEVTSYPALPFFTVQAAVPFVFWGGGRGWSSFKRKVILGGFPLLSPAVSLGSDMIPTRSVSPAHVLLCARVRVRVRDTQATRVESMIRNVWCVVHTVFKYSTFQF